MKLLLTGGNGFVGSRLRFMLEQRGEIALTLSVRSSKSSSTGSVIQIEDLSSNTYWGDALLGQQVVIHTAAKSDMMNEIDANALVAYRKVNVEGTLNLAEQAARAGVKRFIFISSIKVNGELTADTAFSQADPPNFKGPYGQSKFEAEQGLWNIAKETGLEITIIRPPLIYGPGVKGNFKSLLSLVERRLPLPLRGVQNLRSMVAVDNLADLIITCINHPNAANRVFLVSDGHDISTPELLSRLGSVAGKPARLFPMPPALLRMGARILGQQSIADRLLRSLQVDITHTKKTLNWTPPISVEEGLRRCFEPTNKD